MFESSNHRQFQKGLDADKQRSLRRDSQLSLRRQKREANLKKKFRKLTNKPAFYNNAGSSNPSTSFEGEQEAAPKLQDIGKYTGFVMGEDMEKQLIGTAALRKLLSIERDPPTQRVMSTGVIPKIIGFMMSCNNPQNQCNSNSTNSRDETIWNSLQFESAWVITNIAASNSEFTHYICQQGAIQGFVDLFNNTQQPEIADQAIWGLGNIAGDGKHLRDQILQTGFLDDLILRLPGFNNELQRNAVWTISNIFRYNDPLKVSAIHHVVPVLSKLLRECKDPDIQRDCLWAFNYLSNNKGEDMVPYLVNHTNIVHDCMKLLHQEAAKYEIALNQLKSKEKKQRQFFQAANMGNNNSNGGNNDKPAEIQNITKQAMLKMNQEIYRPILRFIGNILSEPDDMTQAVLDAGYLQVIEPWANHFMPTQRKEIMWSFSNILAGTHQQIEALLSRPKLLKSIMSAGMCGRLPVRREAVWCICNAISEAITQQKKLLAEHGAIEVLCGILKPENTLSEDQLSVVVEGLEGFLSLYGLEYNPYAEQVEELHGLDYLEERQSDQNLSENAYTMIIDFIKKYWSEQEGFGEGEQGGNDGGYLLKDKLTAQVDSKTNQFSFGRAGGMNTMNTTNNNGGGRGCNNENVQNIGNRFANNSNLYQF